MAKKKNTKMGLGKRIFLFSFGIVLASTLLIFSFQWQLLPFTITALGYDITPYALAGILVLTGVFASTLIKSGIRGKAELDA